MILAVIAAIAMSPHDNLVERPDHSFCSPEVPLRVVEPAVAEPEKPVQWVFVPLVQPQLYHQPYYQTQYTYSYPVYLSAPVIRSVFGIPCVNGARP